MNWRPIDLNKDITFFVNPTYISLTYDENLTYHGKTLNSQGNQVVDVPTWLIKTGLIYRYDDFEIVPMGRYLTDRYGDVEHREKLGDYLVTDLNLSYTKKLSFTDALKSSLQFHNLLDREYASVINASDDSRAGITSYCVGAAKAGMSWLSEKRSEDEEIVAIVETDACSADAVQVLTGCTFGKGYFIFRDYGKMALTLLSRNSGRGVRVCLKPGAESRPCPPRWYLSGRT